MKSNNSVWIVRMDQVIDFFSDFCLVFTELEKQRVDFREGIVHYCNRSFVSLRSPKGGCFSISDYLSCSS